MKLDFLKRRPSLQPTGVDLAYRRTTNRIGATLLLFLILFDTLGLVFLPAVSLGEALLPTDAAYALEDVLETVDLSMETDLIGRLSSLNARAYTKVQTLDKLTDDLKHMTTSDEQAISYRDAIIPAMEDLRRVVDEMESMTAQEHWPVPAYGELLFGIR